MSGVPRGAEAGRVPAVVRWCAPLAAVEGGVASRGRWIGPQTVNRVTEVSSPGCEDPKSGGLEAARTLSLAG